MGDAITDRPLRFAASRELDIAYARSDPSAMFTIPVCTASPKSEAGDSVVPAANAAAGTTRAGRPAIYTLPKWQVLLGARVRELAMPRAVYGRAHLRKATATRQMP